MWTEFWNVAFVLVFGPGFSDVLGTGRTSLQGSSAVWVGTLLMPELYRTPWSTVHCITPRLRRYLAQVRWPGRMHTNAESAYVYKDGPAVFPDCLIWPSLIQTLSPTQVTTAAALATRKWYTVYLGGSSYLFPCIFTAIKFFIILQL